MKTNFIFTSKSSFQDFLAFKGLAADEQDAEKMAGVYNEFNDGLRSVISEMEKTNASKDDLVAVKAELNETINKQVLALQSVLKELGVVVKRGLVSTEPKNTTLRSQIKKSLTENIENLKTLKTSKDGGFNFVVKSDTLTFANSITGEIPQAQLIPGVDGVPVRLPVFLASLAKRGAQSNLIKWVSKTNKLGAAGATGEGEVKNKISFEFVTGTAEIKKVTAYIKVSTEMLDDIDFMLSEIESELFTELLLAVDADAYNGDGINDNLLGIETVATTFDGGGITAIEPNIVDIAVAASNQIELLNQPEPTMIFLNPTVVNQLKTDKVSSTDRRYIDRLQMIAGSMFIDGSIRIVKTNLVPVDKFLIGNFGMDGFALLYEKGAISMDVGVENDDFTRNFRTILAEWRGAAVVQNNKRSAFVKGQISVAKELIATT